MFLDIIGAEVADKPRGHSGVKNALIFDADSLLSKAGKDLEALHTKRKDADYEMDNRSTENFQEAKTVCAQASRVVKCLDDCCQDTVRFNEVRARVRKWVAATTSCGLRLK
jgi:hypothetical protein